MKREQRILAWTALQYYIEMAEKKRNMAEKLGDSEYWIKYWEGQRIKAMETQEAVLKKSKEVRKDEH